MALPQPGGLDKKPNISHFDGKILSPLRKQFEVVISSYPIVSQSESSKLFLADSFPKDSAIEFFNYAENAEYRNIGVPALIPNIDSTNPADMIAMLELDVISMLRRKGLLLVSGRGEYYLMSAYNGSPILDLLTEIVNLRKAFLNQSRSAMSVNGLKAGVTEGKITDIEGYLSAHHMSYSSKKYAFFDFLDNIESQNFLDQRLQRLLVTEA